MGCVISLLFKNKRITDAVLQPSQKPTGLPLVGGLRLTNLVASGHSATGQKTPRQYLEQIRWHEGLNEAAFAAVGVSDLHGVSLV